MTGPSSKPPRPAIPPAVMRLGKRPSSATGVTAAVATDLGVSRQLRHEPQSVPVG